MLQWKAWTSTLTWGLRREDSDVKTPAGRLWLEDSNLKTPTWRLRLEESDLKTLTWRLRPEDSDLKTLTRRLRLEDSDLWTPNWGLWLRTPAEDNMYLLQLRFDQGERSSNWICADVITVQLLSARIRIRKPLFSHFLFFSSLLFHRIQ